MDSKLDMKSELKKMRKELVRLQNQTHKIANAAQSLMCKIYELENERGQNAIRDSAGRDDEQLELINQAP